jgi:hypothetical protein
MGEYFKPWRRKVGVMTLLMAFVFMGLWMRSRLASDHVTLTTKSYQLITISSRLGILGCSWFDERIGLKFKFGWSADSITANSKASPNSNLLYSWDTPAISTGGRELHRGVSFAIQFCVIVIPLTLLSAYLLLSNPRKSTPKNEVDPVFRTTGIDGKTVLER